MGGMRGAMSNARNMMAGKGKGYSKPKNSAKTLKRIFKYMGKYKFMFFLVMVMTVINALSNIIGTYMLEPVINIIVKEGAAGLPHFPALLPEGEVCLPSA